MDCAPTDPCGDTEPAAVWPTPAESVTQTETSPAAPPTPTPAPPPVIAAPRASAWTLDFTPARPRPSRRVSRKEREVLADSSWRRTAAMTSAAVSASPLAAPAPSSSAIAAADSEGNTTTAAVVREGALPVVSLDGLADRAVLIPRNLVESTRERLEERLCLRIPRLLCVNKQYPRSCGISSLTSVYNYLYSWLGECPESSTTPPVSQEEVMSVLGFEPPFGEIPWGFTGNATLIRWFYELNRHFKRPRGRAYILYKAHGYGKTKHLFDNDTGAILTEVKKVLRNPHCALIYHCYNHYMCPVGYQDIPLAQTDFLKPNVPEENCETTIFIGEVSRGRHEAMYARKWSEIVKDIECQSPYYYNIRHPELGIQVRTKRGDGAATAVEGKRDARATATRTTTPPPMGSTRDGEGSSPPPLPTGADDARTLAEADGAGGPSEVGVVGEGHSSRGGLPSPPLSSLDARGPRPRVGGSGGEDAAPSAAHQPPRRRPREPGNVDCLICFRNDDEEVNPALYESLSDAGSISNEERDDDEDERGLARGRRGGAPADSSDEDAGV